MSPKHRHACCPSRVPNRFTDFDFVTTTCSHKSLVVTMPQSEFPWNLSLCCHHASVLISIEPVTVLSPCPSLNFHRTCRCVNCHPMPSSEFPYNLSLCCHHTRVLMSIEPVTALSPCPSLNFHTTCRCVNCHPMPSSLYNNLYC